MQSSRPEVLRTVLLRPQPSSQMVRSSETIRESRDLLLKLSPRAYQYIDEMRFRREKVSIPWFRPLVESVGYIDFGFQKMTITVFVCRMCSVHVPLLLVACARNRCSGRGCCAWTLDEGERSAEKTDGRLPTYTRHADFLELVPASTQIQPNSVHLCTGTPTSYLSRTAQLPRNILVRIQALLVL